MFRFKQRLSVIHGGRQLTSAEQAGLDAYDIELEDTLSSGGGADTWTFDGADLHPTTDPVSLTVNTTTGDISLNAPDANGNTVIQAGRNIALLAQTDGSFIAVHLLSLEGRDTALLSGVNGLTLTSGSGSVAVTAPSGDITLTRGTGQIKLVGLPTSDPGVSGAVWHSTGTHTLLISP